MADDPPLCLIFLRNLIADSILHHYFCRDEIIFKY